MRKFGDFTDLSENVARFIEDLVVEIENNGLECSLFYGFPLIELDNTSTIMKGCLISKKGIVILHDSDDEKKVYWRHINKTIMECPNISDLAMDPASGLIKFGRCDSTQAIKDYVADYLRAKFEDDKNVISYLYELIGTWIGTGVSYGVFKQEDEYVSKERILVAIDNLLATGELFNLSEESQRRAASYYLTVNNKVEYDGHVSQKSADAWLKERKA